MCVFKESTPTKGDIRGGRGKREINRLETRLELEVCFFLITFFLFLNYFLSFFFVFCLLLMFYCLPRL